MIQKLILIFIGSLSLIACQQAEDSEVTLTETAVPTASPQIGVSFATRAAPTTAVIQTTPTPLPTPTVTPTATPIIYQIEAGDTILGIALQRGTTVDEILTLNPGIVPENLQIGQPVILPPPPTASALVIQGTPRPLQVRVTQIHAYQTPVGSLWLLGEVANEGEVAVENIQVEIGLLAADGRTVGSVSAWVATAIVLAGERAPFGVLVFEPPGDFAEPQVSVVGGQHLVELGTRTLDMAVADAALSVSEDSVALSGTVQNDDITTVSQVQLTATFYDALGNVTGFQQQVVADSLGVGEERPFRLEAAPPGGETVSYALHIEAQKIDN